MLLHPFPYGDNSEKEGVFFQVPADEFWQREFVRLVRCLVDGQSAQVLERGEGVLPVQGFDELQVDGGVLGGKRRGACGLVVAVHHARGDVMLDQAENLPEGQDPGLGQEVGVQAEPSIAVLNAHVGGAAAGLHRQGQQVAGVGAVADEEGSFRHLVELLFRLVSG